MNEHAANLRRLVGAPHPSLDACVGAAGGALTGQKGGQIARCEPYERIHGVQRSDDEFPDFAVGHRIAGARTHDLHNNAFVEYEALT